MKRPQMSVCFAAALLTALACGGSDTDGGAGAGAGGTGPGTEGNAGTGGVGGQSGGGGEGGSLCGNSQVDGVEECDDGNQNPDDGCNTLCEFSCHSDPDCDDQDPCNGSETCSEAHTCVAASQGLNDGEVCGDNMACNQGSCLSLGCGNAVVDDEEECDDGNTDEHDGCTTACLFTCVAGDGARSCAVANGCNPTASCNADSHTCSAGDPLADDTVCAQGDGYCLDGLCILSSCGEKGQEPNEECDEGDKNGTADSDCSALCMLSTCGDGVIDGNEECDDGGNANMDGCNSRCKAETALRLSRLSISRDPAPDFCAFSGNANQGNSFAKLFPATDLILYTTMSDLLNGVFADGSANVLMQFMDLEDSSAQTADPLVTLGLTSASVTEDWAGRTDKLDFPVTVDTDAVDQDGVPTAVMPAELVVENGRTELRTTAPSKAGFVQSDADFTLYQAMTRIEIDSGRSQPPPPPDYADSIELPITAGGQAAAAPEAVLCGAMMASSFKSIPMPQQLADLCIEPFVACLEGQDPLLDECDSILDLFQQGCMGFLGLIPILDPIGEPDADTDGDGVPDAYSAVVKTSLTRVKLMGVADPPPPAP